MAFPKCSSVLQSVEILELARFIANFLSVFAEGLFTRFAGAVYVSSYFGSNDMSFVKFAALLTFLSLTTPKQSSPQLKHSLSSFLLINMLKTTSLTWIFFLFCSFVFESALCPLEVSRNPQINFR